MRNAEWGLRNRGQRRDFAVRRLAEQKMQNVDCAIGVNGASETRKDGRAGEFPKDLLWSRFLNRRTQDYCGGYRS